MKEVALSGSSQLDNEDADDADADANDEDEDEPDLCQVISRASKRQRPGRPQSNLPAGDYRLYEFAGRCVCLLARRLARSIGLRSKRFSFVLRSAAAASLQAPKLVEASWLYLCAARTKLGDGARDECRKLITQFGGRSLSHSLN